jgi:phage terminase large subunit
MKIKTTTTLKKISALKKRIWSIVGSQGAGKTFSILILLINAASSSNNKEIYVVGTELTKLKLGAIKDFKKILEGLGLFKEENWLGTENMYRFPNGSFIKFVGLDRASTFKGVRSDIIFFNEANHIDFESYRQGASRAKRVIIDYNPDKICWIQEQVEVREDCDFLRVTWRDNEYLDKGELADIKRYTSDAFNDDGSIKNNYWYNIWRVYSEGLIGQMQGTIFQDWELGEFDETLDFGYGADYGTNDPDTLTKIAIDKANKRIYLDEVIYQNNLSTDALITLYKTNVIPGKVIIGDSAASRTIEDIKKAGLNIKAVSKNKIVDDIKLLQSYKIIVTKTSKNIIEEFSNYAWLDGKSNTPIDKYNHAIDGTRYYCQTILGIKERKQPRILYGN